jgi:hypothetical protein
VCVYKMIGTLISNHMLCISKKENVLINVPLIMSMHHPNIYLYSAGKQ